MARYTGPVCRLCRREKTKLFLKGPKCDSMKCPIEKRPYPPGEHGRGRIGLQHDGLRKAGIVHRTRRAICDVDLRDARAEIRRLR